MGGEVGRGGPHNDKRAAVVPAATTAQPVLGPGTELQLLALLRLAGEDRLCGAEEPRPRSQGQKVPELEPDSIPPPPPHPV